MTEIARLKISNVCSLSNAEKSDSPTFSSFGMSKILLCAVCRLEIAVHKLKLHIFTRHFPFYRPYQCKKCAFKCGSVEIFLKEHTIFSNHSELKENTEKSPYLELLVNLFYQHSLKLYDGDISSVLNQLASIRKNFADVKQQFIVRRPVTPPLDGVQSPSSTDFYDASAMFDQISPLSSLSRLRLSTQHVRQATDSAELTSPRLHKRRRAREGDFGDDDGDRASSSMSSVSPPSMRGSLDGKRQKFSESTTGPPENLLIRASMTVETSEMDKIQRTIENQMDEQPNLFANFSVQNLGGFSDKKDQIITLALDAIVDHKNIPVFSNIDGIDMEKATAPNQTMISMETQPVVTHTVQKSIPATIQAPPTYKKPILTVVETPPTTKKPNGSVVEAPPKIAQQTPTVGEAPPKIAQQIPTVVEAPPTNSALINEAAKLVPPNKAFGITCDFCLETCANKDMLKQHLLNDHCGGFQGFYCSACDFKSANQHRAVDHCRNLHKNTKFLKRTKPTMEELDFLKKIKESLDQREIKFDFTVYENL